MLKLGHLALYGKKPLIVLSGGRLDFSLQNEGRVEQMSGEPDQIVKQLEARGFRHAYLDGGLTIQRLAAGLINGMVITRVAVLIGESIPLFGPLPATLLFIILRRIAMGAVSYRVNMKSSCVFKSMMDEHDSNANGESSGPE